MAVCFSAATMVLLVLTAFVHSWFGERLLIGPLLRRRLDPAAKNPLGRFVLRFGWHMMSISFVALSAVLWVSMGSDVDHHRMISGIVGVIFALCGLFDAVASRGRHIGWPLLMLIGVCGLGAALSGEAP